MGITPSNVFPDARVSLVGWQDLPLEKLTEMIARKVVRGERQTLAQVYLKKGALVPWHAQEGEAMIYVLEGALRVEFEAGDATVREGDVLRLVAGVPHQAEALDDTFLIDVSSPAREDWAPADAPARREEAR